MDFQQEIIIVLKKLKELKGLEIALEVPKDKSMGDYAFPCFALAKTLKKNPVEIAKELVANIDISKSDAINDVKAVGPYINFFVNESILAEDIIIKILKNKLFQKKTKEVSLVESPGPNTNKPLHLGHIRNGFIATTIMNLLKILGHKVHHVDVINDRGIHICKSMLAYQRWGDGDTPEKSGMKTDHFVGKYYVLFSQKARTEPELEDEAKELLIKWENGDKDVRALWKKMNSWATKGMFETYKRLGLDVEKAYCESDTYMLGKDFVLDGLKKKVFAKRDDGVIFVDLSDKGLGEKVLIRSDGTAVYITQDLGMINLRNKDFHMDRMIYVVGNEQIYHFKVLFEIFKLLKYPFADKCFHLNYGMVNLPEGKMKSREGTIVDADNLMDKMIALARDEIKKRYEDLSDKEIEARAEMIGMGALRFFILKYDSANDFVFNPKESISFDGETGPYVQYAHTRICSILDKHGKKANFKADLSLLKQAEERILLNMLSRFEETVYEAAEKYRPHLIARYVLDLAQAFNEYYHKHQILKEKDDIRDARLVLITAIKQVLENGLGILDIKAPERM